MPSREVSSSEKREVGWTRLRTTISVLAVLGMTSEFSSYSILTPFYPSVAKGKGNDATQIGFVMSVPSVVGLVCTPLAGKMISSGLSPRKVAFLGLVIDGIFLISMSFLTMLESPLSFFVVSLLLRLGESIGLSLCIISFYALISPQFPNNFELVVPLFEVCVGIGSMIGSAAGSLLYEIGGFHLPFTVFGASSLVLATAIFILIPEEQGVATEQNDTCAVTKPSKLKISHLLKDHRVVTDLLVVLGGSYAIGFHSSTLALWIEQFDLSISMKSLIFFTYGIVYSISTVIDGFLSRLFEDCRFLVAFNSIIFFIGIAVSGPLPFLPIEPSPWLSLLGQFLMGIANAAFYALTLTHGLKYVTCRLNYPPEPATYAVLTSMFAVCYFLGMAIGPVLGGVLLDTIGYRWGTAVVLLKVVILVLPLYLSVLRDHAQKVPQSTRDSMIQMSTTRT